MERWREYPAVCQYQSRRKLLLPDGAWEITFPGIRCKMVQVRIVISILMFENVVSIDDIQATMGNMKVKK